MEIEKNKLYVSKQNPTRLKEIKKKIRLFLLWYQIND
ncbi:hypothetical protein HWC97_gp47 [Flavobacterium phage vB_FspS_snusmum6-1]|uniref:Uncharacterized protein n=3 Tax=Muminvirus snusmum TaxID=2844298 RepID=A0A6B9LG23_9CAUD|nr:hypothetical protein HWC97_gp47 [Flavobacterium phage vB_FspS_snusmum6-1]QHB40621.1 hypothetical protein snusmum61_gp047 [Flavobacterium phage vB_FspS_snusmum6-1]QHB40693.1 hypothetical protein snusmum62_gp047 [Flavobacterium phage vB_FspS_snusmum6-2]QHB40766.1 hypothetical protein snusmum63_gp047 [Flavobacterium phage vB_FspS_snusmum6-3]